MHRIRDVDAIRLAAERRINQIQRTVAVQSLTGSHENVATVIFDGQRAVHDVDVAKLNCRRRIDHDRAVLEHLESTGREDRRAFAGLAGRCRDVECAVSTDCQAGNRRCTDRARDSFCRDSSARTENGNVMIRGRRLTRRPVRDIIKIAASAAGPISRSHVAVILYYREQSRKYYNQSQGTQLLS